MKINTLLWQYLAQFLLGWEMFQTKILQKPKHTCYVQKPSPPPCRAVWDNVEKHARAGQATDDNRHMRFACWIPQAINTLSEYVILIDFPLQQWLHERASMLRYTYIASLVYSPFIHYHQSPFHIQTYTQFILLAGSKKQPNLMPRER